MPERSSGDVTFLYLYSGEKEYPFNLALFIFLQLIVSPYQNYKYYHFKYYYGDMNGIQRTL